MAITLDREAYEEFRCFGLPDEYPKDIRAAVMELRQRGYDASVAVLNYLIEQDRLRLTSDGWSAPDIDAAATELADLEQYTPEAHAMALLGLDAEQYHRALAEAWDRVAKEFGDAAVSVSPNPDYFIMHVYPPRFGWDGYVEFTLCEDARLQLVADHEATSDIKGIVLPAQQKRRAAQ